MNATSVKRVQNGVAPIHGISSCWGCLHIDTIPVPDRCNTNTIQVVGSHGLLLLQYRHVSLVS